MLGGKWYENLRSIVTNFSSPQHWSNYKRRYLALRTKTFVVLRGQFVQRGHRSNAWETCVHSRKNESNGFSHQEISMGAPSERCCKGKQGFGGQLWLDSCTSLQKNVMCAKVWVYPRVKDKIPIHIIKSLLPFPN